MTLPTVSPAVAALNPGVFSAPLVPIPEGTAQTESERDLQRLCELDLSRRGIPFLHLSYRAREKAGWPDLTFVRPNNSNVADIPGIPWAIELKSATGRLSKEQERLLADLSGSGWRTAVVRDFAEWRRVVFNEQSTERPKGEQ